METLLIVGPAFTSKETRRRLPEPEFVLPLFIRLYYPTIHLNYLSAFSNEVISGHTVVTGRAASPERQAHKGKDTALPDETEAAPLAVRHNVSLPHVSPPLKGSKKKNFRGTLNTEALSRSQRRGLRVITLFMAVK